MESIAKLKEIWLKKAIDGLVVKGMTKAKIADMLEVKPQYINNILNGGRGITDGFLDKFIEKFEINQFDLLGKCEENVSIPDLISQLKEQAEEIGRLKERIITLEREKGKSASHAPTADAANAV